MTIKIKLLILLSLFSINNISAQDVIVPNYFDSSWNKTTQDSAFYITEYQKVDLNFQATTYWSKSKTIYSISYSPDTSYSKQVGLSKKYYESGQLKDSSFYDSDGRMINSFYYHPTGRLWVNYSYDSKNDKEIIDAFDINGKQLEDFVYFREAEFPGGKSEWQAFLGNNIKSRVPIKKGAPNGTYKVIVRFIIDSNGKVINIMPETNFGFGMKDEVIRIIKKSPKWIPAIWLNKTTKAYRRQPLTFVVSEE